MVGVSSDMSLILPDVLRCYGVTGGTTAPVDPSADKWGQWPRAPVLAQRPTDNPSGWSAYWLDAAAIMVAVISTKSLDCID